MAGDFMRPVVDVVDQLLSAGVNVTVYNGQLDLIVDTMGVWRRVFQEHGLQGVRLHIWMSAGQELWVKTLKWDGLPGFNKLKWTALYDPTSPGVTGAFYKTYRNFAFYWILKAGHMVRYWLNQCKSAGKVTFYAPESCSRDLWVIINLNRLISSSVYHFNHLKLIWQRQLQKQPLESKDILF